MNSSDASACFFIATATTIAALCLPIFFAFHVFGRMEEVAQEVQEEKR